MVAVLCPLLLQSLGFLLIRANEWTTRKRMSDLTMDILRGMTDFGLRSLYFKLKEDIATEEDFLGNPPLESTDAEIQESLSRWEQSEENLNHVIQILAEGEAAGMSMTSPPLRVKLLRRYIAAIEEGGCQDDDDAEALEDYKTELAELEGEAYAAGNYCRSCGGVYGDCDDSCESIAERDEELRAYAEQEEADRERNYGLTIDPYQLSQMVKEEKRRKTLESQAFCEICDSVGLCFCLAGVNEKEWIHRHERESCGRGHGGRSAASDLDEEIFEREAKLDSAWDY